MTTNDPDCDHVENAEKAEDLHTRVKEMLRKLENLEDLILYGTKRQNKPKSAEPQRPDEISGLRFSDDQLK